MKKGVLLLVVVGCLWVTAVGAQQIPIPSDNMFPRWLSGKLQVQNLSREGTIAFYSSDASGALKIPSKGCRISLPPNKGIKVDVQRRQFVYTIPERATFSCTDDTLTSSFGIVRSDNSEFDEDPFLWVSQARPQAAIASVTPSATARLDRNSVYILITGNRDLPYLLVELLGSENNSTLFWVML